MVMFPMKYLFVKVYKNVRNKFRKVVLKALHGHTEWLPVGGQNSASES
jgi:hypothetical protein